MKKIVSFLLVFVLFLTPVSTAYATFDFDAISGNTILRNGYSGSSVKKLQKALIKLGYLPKGSADGAYGSKTEKAVKAFQRKNGFAGEIGYAGTATMFTQAALYSSGAIPKNSSRSIENDVSGEYGIRNSKLRYTTTLDGSFEFVNYEKRHVKAICIYSWLEDSKERVVTMDGSDFWIWWWYNCDIPQNGTKEITCSLDATSKELGKAKTLRFIVGEIVYDNDSTFVTFNASEPPYHAARYTLGSW